MFGWNRQAVELGLHERRTGVVCLSVQSAFAIDNKLWEEKHPASAAVLWELAQAHSQQAPTFRTPLSFTRLIAAQALAQLRARGVAEAEMAGCQPDHHQTSRFSSPFRSPLHWHLRVSAPYPRFLTNFHSIRDSVT